MRTAIFKAGDKVLRIHPYDGSCRAGRPAGPALTVIESKMHKPVDGPGAGYIVALSDGGWEFEWNVAPAGQETC